MQQMICLRHAPLGHTGVFKKRFGISSYHSSGLECLRPKAHPSRPRNSLEGAILPKEMNYSSPDPAQDIPETTQCEVLSRIWTKGILFQKCCSS